MLLLLVSTGLARVVLLLGVRRDWLRLLETWLHLSILSWRLLRRTGLCRKVRWRRAMSRVLHRYLLRLPVLSRGCRPLRLMLAWWCPILRWC